MVSFPGPPPRRCGAVDAAAGRSAPAHRTVLGGQFSSRCYGLVRPADGCTRRIRGDRYLLLHSGASRDCAPSHQRAAGSTRVCRLLRDDGPSLRSQPINFSNCEQQPRAGSMRAIVLVMDSVGIGAAPDAAAYGDAGADTVGHIAEACARGHCDTSLRGGPLHLPNLAGLGLGEACRLAGGQVPLGLETRATEGRYGCAAEISRGKDTPSGHWELAGVPVLFDWGYFPRTIPCFPNEIVSELCERASLPGILGDCHASGTEIIARLGDEHVRSGMPICYTSADSVFQIAAHEHEFGLERLYSVCEIARELLEPLNIGRVIARPFRTSQAEYLRTANRRDYAVPPPGQTILDLATGAGRDVITVGKI